MNYLLDTCTFLWLATDPHKLSRTAKSILNDQGNDLYLSDTSQWEIVLKAQAGKLQFPRSVRSWLPATCAGHHLHLLTIKASAIYLSGELPDVHRDPFDRLLAAQTIDSGMTIISPDTPLSALGASRIW